MISHDRLSTLRTALATVTLTASGFVSVAHADVPPTGGTCQVSPAVGRADSTPFTVACAGWMDRDGEVPLRYRFACLDGMGVPVALSAYSLEPSIHTMLPEGIGALSRLSLIAVVQDASGATTAVSLSVHVVGVGEDSTQAFAAGLADSIERELDGGNPGAVIDYAATIGDNEADAKAGDDALIRQLADRAASLVARAKALRVARKILNKTRKTGIVAGAKCRFWDPDEEIWDSQGCSYQVVDTITTCSCTHL
jgi:hypothetical protein